MDPQQVRYVMGNQRAMYSIVQSRRSGDPQVCIPNREVSTVKPKKAVGQKSRVGLNGPPQLGDEISAQGV